jgi:endonuclease YncB( thermonuclease family)
MVAPALTAPIDVEDVFVRDGDTIEVFHEPPNVRLVGFNAGETDDRAHCPAEREIGLKATRRLRELVHAGDLDFEFVK